MCDPNIIFWGNLKTKKIKKFKSDLLIDKKKNVRSSLTQ